MKKIYVDATNKSIAIVENEFFVNIPADADDIVYNELYAVLIGLKYAATQETPVTIYTDNEGVLCMIDKGRCKNTKINQLLREVLYWFERATKSTKHVVIEVVNGKQNLADVISRKVRTDDWHNHFFIYQ